MADDQLERMRRLVADTREAVDEMAGLVGPLWHERAVLTERTRQAEQAVERELDRNAECLRHIDKWVTNYGVAEEQLAAAREALTWYATECTAHTFKREPARAALAASSGASEPDE